MVTRTASAPPHDPPASAGQWFRRIFDALSGEPYMGYAIIDGSLSRFTDTGGARKDDFEPGHLMFDDGMTTRISALTDALGNLVRFHLMSGHRFDSIGMAPPIERVEFGALLADKACKPITVARP